MKFYIDRNLPTTLIEQIKGQITYAIASGTLRPGSPLPSVRELSAELDVATMTITRVYRELSEEQWIVTKPGVGTFVADMTAMDLKKGTRNAQESLYQVADAFLRQALAQGHTPSQIREAFLKRLDHYCLNSTGLHVAIVGNFRSVTEAYAREAEGILQDLNVKVRTVLRSELQDNLKGVRERLRGVKVVIAVPTHLPEIRSLLEPYGYNVVAVAFEVSPETRHRVASISPTAQVGVVATYPEFLNSLVEGVVSYGLLETPPLYALIDQEEFVKDMLTQVDVIVYASGSERILEWLPVGVEAFEYRHTPEPDSLNRLRPLLSKRTVEQEELIASEGEMAI